MKDNDLVISAGGITMYELCALKIPSIIYTLADNQISESKFMGECGCVEYVGDVRDGEKFWNSLNSRIYLLIHDSTRRNSMVKKMKSIVDGQGCRRIVEKIVEMETNNESEIS
jgi:spore coat polysaccharide biosynthesis predicted glycosyltransferase SpsG